MPNIRSFQLTPQQAQLRPSESGPSAFERVATSEQRAGLLGGEALSRGFQTFGRAVDQVGSQQEDKVAQLAQQAEIHNSQQEILNGAVAHTQLAVKAATELPGILAKSDDPVKAMQDYYDNTYGPEVDKINSSMGTQKGQAWAAEHSEKSRETFFLHGMGEAMNIQGARTVAKFQQTTDNLTTAAHANPDGLADYVQQSDGILDSVKDQMTPQQQASLEEHRSNIHAQIALSAGHALADQSAATDAKAFAAGLPPPQNFEKQLNGGWASDFLNEEQRQSLLSYSKVARAQNETLARQASQDGVDNLTSRIYDPTNGRIDYKAAAQAVGQANQDPNIMQRDRNKVGAFVSQAVRAQHMEDIGEQQLKANRDDPGTTFALMKGISEGTTTLDDIGQAAIAGKITVGRMSELAGSLQKPAADALAKVVGDPLVKSQVDQGEAIIRGSTDPGNQAVRDKSDQYKIDVYTKMRNAQMNGQDPRQFVDPKSPTYIDPSLYKPSQQEVADQLVQHMKDLPIKPVKPTASTLEFMLNQLKTLLPKKESDQDVINHGGL